MFKHVIIGGGVAGASIAYHLSRALPPAAQILLIEKSTFDAPKNANRGIILDRHASAIGREMTKHTIADIYRLGEKHDIGHERLGSVEIGDGPMTDLERLKQQNTINLIQQVAPEALNNEFVKISPDEVRRFTPNDGLVCEDRLAKAYLSEARGRGVLAIEKTEVSHIDLSDTNKITIETPDGSVEAGNVINTTRHLSEPTDSLPTAEIVNHRWRATITRHAPITLPIVILPQIYLRFSGYNVDIGIREIASSQTEADEKNGWNALLRHYRPLRGSIVDFDNLLMRDYVTTAAHQSIDGLPAIERKGRLTSVAVHSRQDTCWIGGLGRMVASAETPMELDAGRFQKIEVNSAP